MLFPFAIFAVLVFCHSSQAQEDKSVSYEQNFANKIFEKTTETGTIDTPHQAPKISNTKETEKESSEGDSPESPGFTELNEDNEKLRDIKGEPDKLDRSYNH